jgi:hypothetical protein
LLDAVNRAAVRIFAALLLMAISACSRAVKLELPPGAPVILTTFHEDPKTTLVQPRKVTLSPNTPDYRRLQKWVAENQHGWSQAVAADPSGGVVVEAGNLHLHFFDGGVSAPVAGGVVQKNVPKEDYAFLEEAAAHLSNR